MKNMIHLFDKMRTGVYIIAEMSANHGGSLDRALEIVRQSKKAGADCIKIQTYTADTLTINCKKKPFLIKGGLWDGYTYYDLYKEAYTPWEWQETIKKECERAGIDFLSTPFDKTAVDYLEEIGIEFYKVSSFELVDIPLIEYIASKGKPMILSCGLADAEEIQEAVDACRNQGNQQIVLLKCCSQYPAKYCNMNLSVIPDMKERFQVPVGLSDHSFGSLADIAAAALGARVIEKHVMLDEGPENADSGFSMKMSEFSKMIKDVEDTVEALGRATYELTVEEQGRLDGRRSLFAVERIEKGQPFTPDNIRSIRPGNGLKPKYYKELLGQKSKGSYEYGDPVSGQEISQ